MRKEKLESYLEEAAKKGIIDLVAILGTSLTVRGKQYRIQEIARTLVYAACEEEETIYEVRPKFAKKKGAD